MREIRLYVRVTRNDNIYLNVEKWWISYRICEYYYRPFVIAWMREYNQNVELEGGYSFHVVTVLSVSQYLFDSGHHSDIGLCTVYHSASLMLLQRKMWIYCDVWRQFSDRSMLNATIFVSSVRIVYIGLKFIWISVEKLQFCFGDAGEFLLNFEIGRVFRWSNRSTENWLPVKLTRNKIVY